MINLHNLISTLGATMLSVCAPAALLAQSQSPAAKQFQVAQAEAEEFVAFLQSDAPQFQKTLACKRLAAIGSKEAVAALAPLLGDEQLSHGARIALEAIPDAAAAEALHAAMRSLKGKLLVGVINSIGARRDEGASAALGRLMADSDREVAVAAAAALGKIASSRAASIVEQAVATAPEAIRPALADAGLACAEAMVTRGKRNEAAQLYDRLQSFALPKHIRLAATRGTILARQPSGTELLVTELQAEDDAFFTMALGVSRELSGPDVTAALVGQLPRLPPERQALLIAALADRGDAGALPALLKAATSEHLDVRIAAIGALSTLGDASAIPPLLESLDNPETKIATAAQESLATMALPEVNAAIVSKLDNAKGQSRRLLLELVGRRRIASAANALAGAAEDRDEETRVAALRALGMTSNLEQLPVLTRHLMASTNPGEKAAAQEGLQATCTRLAGNNACAEQLVSCLTQASPDSKCLLIELLAVVGGPTALRAVATSASDANVEIQNAATRVLGEWSNPEAAPTLLELAQTLPNSKLRIRVLRGYVRIIRQMDLPDQQKLEMCQDAMRAAQRDDERALAMEAMGRIPLPEAMAVALSHAQSANLREAASAAVVSIAESIVAIEPEAVAKTMDQVLQIAKKAETRQRATDVLNRAQTGRSKRP